MIYYNLLVASQKYHGDETLTYASSEELSVGQIVRVPLRNQVVLAVVLSITTKPNFTAKSIEDALPAILPPASLQLLDWMIHYYAAPSGATTSLFLPRSLGKLPLASKLASPAKLDKPTLQPKLTDEQQSILRQIASSTSRSFLLHGSTGSGKTRVYLELTQNALKAGQSVLVLTPEISLTPQLVKDFEASLGKRVIVLHSHLTEALRRNAWLKVMSATEPIVVIGPRSALFVPFKSLGLIVLDEAHEAAYKQEQLPRYHATRVAAKLTELHKATFIMGSATPNVTDYYIAKAKEVPILEMHKLAVTSTTNKVNLEVVLARDRENFVRDQHLSEQLIGVIEQSITNGKQALVFLNRRGSARLILCQRCGWQALCPNCDLPLTYHADQHQLRCHTCGYKTHPPTHCPICSATELIYKSVGTKAITTSLERLFPNAKIARYDSDNLKSERLEEQYSLVASGKIDILVGTQLLAKGLDLPHLAVVGMVTADTSLSFPDYTSDERTYQLLVQIIGRVGRGHTAGKAIIQTYNPDSAALRAVIDGNWQVFYDKQLSERRQFKFPPYCYLLKLTCTRKTVANAARSAEELARILRDQNLAIEVIGPTPSFFEKSSAGYRWQLVVKSKTRQLLVDIVRQLPANWLFDLDPTNLL